MCEPARWVKAITSRKLMKLPGVPSVRQEAERRFDRSATSEAAAAAVGDSSSGRIALVQASWWYARVLNTIISGRYSSFAAHEEITPTRACGVHQDLCPQANLQPEQPSLSEKQLRFFCKSQPRYNFSLGVLFRIL